MTDLWDKLRQSKKPVVIYGMGDGCDKIWDVCREKGILVKGIFASDEYVRPKIIHGLPLRTLSQLREELGDVVALLAFGVFREDLMQQILSLEQEIELYAPEVPLFGGGLFDLAYARAHRRELEAVWEMLEDEASRKVFSGLIEYKLTGKIPLLTEIESLRTRDLAELIPYRPGDSYLDLGAYDGDTVLEWHSLHPDHGEIVALEPNEKTYRKMLEGCKEIPFFRPVCAAAWNTETTLSFRGKSGRSAAVSPEGETVVRALPVSRILSRCDFIKMDVEGAEREAIEGARDLIQSQRPALCISAYHRTEDIFAIPLQIKAICPEYRVRLRHTPYVPAWDTFYYFSLL